MDQRELSDGVADLLAETDPLIHAAAYAAFHAIKDISGTHADQLAAIVGELGYEVFCDKGEFQLRMVVNWQERQELARRTEAYYIRTDNELVQLLLRLFAKFDAARNQESAHLRAEVLRLKMLAIEPHAHILD